MRNLPFLLFLALISTAVDLSAQARLKFSLAEADTILIDFNEAIKTYHPYSYQEDGAKSLDSLLIIIRARLKEEVVDDSIHVADLVELTSTFNQIIGDGHLQLTRKRAKNYDKKKRLYNYEFYTRYVDDGRIILSDTLTLLDSTTFYPGTEVATFQGEPIKEVYQKIGSFIGLADHNIASAKTYFPALDPGSFYQYLYGWKDSLTAGLIVEGEFQEITLIPSAKQAYLSRDTTQITEVEQPKKLTRKQNKQDRIDRLNRLIKLDTTSNPEVYKLGIRTFSSGAYKKVNQYKRIKTLMKRVDSLQLKGLVIDLRNNTGGSLNFVNFIFGTIAESNFYSGDAAIAYHRRVKGKNFFSRFRSSLSIYGARKKNGVYHKKGMVKKSKPKKGDFHFGGEVIALVNETTFSGGTVFANYVQVYERGKVVGQVPGGSAERMFAGTLFKVPIGPEKSLLINMPLWFMDMPGDQKGNIRPDVIVPRLAEKVIAQEDYTLEVALQQFSFAKQDDSL